MNTNAVRDSATRFDAKIEAADFNTWLKETIADAFDSGFRLGQKESN